MLSIKKYTEKKLTEWNKFVNLSNNGTLFHNRKFLSYHLNRDFIDCSLLFFDSDRLIAVLPAAEIKENKKKIFFSHPGASYGGFIISENLKFKTINEIINLLEQYCVDNHFNEIILINTPPLYFKNRTDNIDYLLGWNQFEESETYISHITDLTLHDDLNCFLGKRKKRYLKNINSEFHINFAESKDVKSFYSILFENKKKYNTSPTHSLKEMEKLIKDFPNHIRLFLSSKNDEIVGGTFLFFLNERIGLVFYNVILENYRNSQLSTIQLFNVMKIFKSAGLKSIDFGVSHTPELKNPLTPKLSLIEFKEQFGANGVIRKVYRKDLK